MKLKLASLCAVFLVCSIFNQAFAQNLQVTGKVTKKSTGEGLSGASVVVRGGGVATRTDENGNYSLSIPQKTATIVVTYSGMVLSEQRITQSGEVNFAMDEEVNVLTDVVVIGYGTQKITKVSGAISTVKAADIEKLKPVRAEEALQGLASGVNVISSGSPGAAPTVLIRGIPSFTGTNPLVIIDGVPQEIVDLNSLSPSDIESINVLKDAATMAIYGVKGGNGIIVVTTKTGRKNQKTELTFNANFGIQEVQRTIGVLNASEYAAILNEGSVMGGENVLFPDLSIFGKGTNWQDEIFEKAPIQNHSISARGGSEKMTYFLSAAYLSQGGIVGGYDKSRFNRGTFTANMVYDLTPRLKFILNTTGVLLNSKGIAENSFNSIIGNALNFDPTVPVYNNVPNTVGTYSYSNLILREIFNPLTRLENTYNENLGNKLFGKFELQYEIIKGLKFNSRFGYTKYEENGRSFDPLVFYGPSHQSTTMEANGSTRVQGGVPYHNSVNQYKNNNFNFTWETFGTYNFKINDDHNFETVAGVSLAKTSGNGNNVSRQDVPFNSWDFAKVSAATGINFASVDPTIPSNINALNGGAYQYYSKNASAFGRVNYDYKEKYMASFTARRDGSIAFGPQNKFANFFSGSLGWLVSKEDFFTSKTIDFLKIRGSYGTSGNEKTPPQSSQIITGGPSYGNTQNSNGYTFGGVFYPGATLGTSVNPALRWEKQTQFNIGFDVAIWSNKLTLSADYFRKEVDGLLFRPSVPFYIGTAEIPDANIGSTRSSGVDLNLTYNTTVAKHFKISNSLTFTTSKNLVTATNEDGTAKYTGGNFFNGQSIDITVFEKGQTPGYFYGYKTNGLFQNQAEIPADSIQAKAAPGDIRFVDLNGDGKITSADQTKIGDPFPDFTMGWNLNLAYKNIDLTVFTYASVGNDIYVAYERNENVTNKPRSILGRWTGEGTTNDVRYPRYTFKDLNNNSRASDRYVEDGSFVKIKNIQLGYTFPSHITGKIFKGLRIYGQVRNAFTFTKYSGFDPEISGGIFYTGVDKGAYPQARTYAVGVDIKL
ncbi:MAG: TonB-dependent receptor [Rhizobacter sp.]|nr:TonB-dependent receptor [Ferruginibacter sp.]